MEYTAYLKNLRMSQRKVQSVAKLVKKLPAQEAIQILDNLPKRAGEPLKKLINSALANAKQNSQVDKEALYVKDLNVDPGSSFKRYRPRARGRAGLILKRTSHIRVVLEERKKSPTKQKKQSK
jgi:large subunit ribosomal protein L22